MVLPTASGLASGNGGASGAVTEAGNEASKVESSSAGKLPAGSTDALEPPRKNGSLASVGAGFTSPGLPEGIPPSAGGPDEGLVFGNRDS